MIDDAINLDSTADLLNSEVHPNQKSLTITIPSSSQPIGTSILPTITYTEAKNEKGKITKMTMTNNIIYDSQISQQVRTIMIYDIPSTQSHEDILNSLKEWVECWRYPSRPNINISLYG